MNQVDIICEKARDYANVIEGTSCNQTSFKAKKGKFLFIGPGPKGIGYKAMFKLQDSIAEAEALANKSPTQYQIGKGWVTVRFSDKEPIPESVWQKWLEESYLLSQ